MLYSDPAWIAALLARNRRPVTDMLRRKGLRPDDAAEAFDEAVTRLVTLPLAQRPTGRRQVAKFLRVVAFRYADQARNRGPRIELHAEPGEAAFEPDPAMLVEYELRLRDAFAAIASMPEADQRVVARTIADTLAEYVGATLDTPWARAARTGETDDPSANRMRLSRARAELRRRTAGWLAGLAWWRRGSGPRPVPASLTAAVCAATIIAAVPAGTTAGRATPLNRPTAERTSTSTAFRASTPMPPSPEPTTSGRGPALEPDATRPHRTDVPVLTTTGPPPEPIIAGNLADVSNHRRPPGDDSLVCVRRLRGVEDTCIPHPLRPGTEPPTGLP